MPHHTSCSVLLTKLIIILHVIASCKKEPKEFHVRLYSNDETENCVFGERPASIKDHPFMVLVANLETRTLCQGTLISPDWVLTSGSCLQQKENNGTIYALFHVHDLNSNKVRAIEGTPYIHPRFLKRRKKKYNNQVPAHDIGLLKLKEPVLCVPCVKIGNKNVDGSDYCKSVSWVVNDVQFHPESNTMDITLNHQRLFEETQNMINVFHCKYLFGKHLSSKSKTFESGVTNGTQAFYDETGGPLLYQGVQIGIIPPNRHGKEYREQNCATWIRIANYLDWISSVVSQREQRPKVLKDENYCRIPYNKLDSCSCCDELACGQDIFPDTELLFALGKNESTTVIPVYNLCSKHPPKSKKPFVNYYDLKSSPERNLLCLNASQDIDFEDLDTQKEIRLFDLEEGPLPRFRMATSEPCNHTCGFSMCRDCMYTAFIIVLLVALIGNSLVAH